MTWIDKIVKDITERYPDGDLLIESGASPSGVYHLGHLREVIISDALVLELRQKGRVAKHIHFVDDLDALRKIPVNVPSDYEKYLGVPLCDIPSPADPKISYSQAFVNDLIKVMDYLGIEVETIYSHEKYRSGFFAPAIEVTLENATVAKGILEHVSQRKLDENWSPIQIMEGSRLKNRKFVSLNKDEKTIKYKDADGNEKLTSYLGGEVKLDWRLDWPARWWLLKVSAEAFGRDHATKGGSYDTGSELLDKVFKMPGIIPVPYDFVNRSGDPKKMSASKGTGVDAVEATEVLPAEVIRFFMLRYGPEKRLYFDEVDGVVRLIDEFAELAAKSNKTEEEEQLFYLSTRGVEHRTISSVPFSHLVTSYQAALKDTDKTIEIIDRTEYSKVVEAERDLILTELKFIDAWLDKWAPEDVKFKLLESVSMDKFSETEKKFLSDLAKKIEGAPKDIDGDWFHNAIYELKETSELSPNDLFKTLYRLLIGKESGPRAGWFLSILPRDWLVSRLRMEK